MDRECGNCKWWGWLHPKQEWGMCDFVAANGVASSRALGIDSGGDPADIKTRFDFFCNQWRGRMVVSRTTPAG